MFRREGEICSTTAINTAEYCGAFTELRKECGALIHFTIGSALSSCYQNAVLAAEEVPWRHGGGLHESYHRNRLSGRSRRKDGGGWHGTGSDCNEAGEFEDLHGCELCHRQAGLFTEGRTCSAVTAFGANLLNIRPSISVRDGNWRWTESTAARSGSV